MGPGRRDGFVLAPSLVYARTRVGMRRTRWS